MPLTVDEMFGTDRGGISVEDMYAEPKGSAPEARPEPKRIAAKPKGFFGGMYGRPRLDVDDTTASGGYIEPLPDSKAKLKKGRWYNLPATGGKSVTAVWHPETDQFYDLDQAKASTSAPSDRNIGISWTGAVDAAHAEGYHSIGSADLNKMGMVARGEVATEKDYKPPLDPTVFAGELPYAGTAAEGVERQLEENVPFYKNSPIARSVVHGLLGAGTKVSGVLSHAFGGMDMAGEFNRAGAAQAQASEIARKEIPSSVPPEIQSIAQGGVEFGAQLAAGGGSWPMFMVESAAGAASEAETRASDAGFGGAKKAAYVAGHAAVDLLTNYLFGKFGAPTKEIADSITGAAEKSLEDALRSLPKSVFSGSAVQSASTIAGRAIDKMSGIDPTSFTWDQIKSAVGDAMLTQTVFAGVSHALIPALRDAPDAVRKMIDSPTIKNVQEAIGHRIADYQTRNRVADIAAEPDQEWLKQPQEATDATQTGQEERQQQHPGVQPRADLPADQTQVRGGQGPQAGDRGGAAPSGDVQEAVPAREPVSIPSSPQTREGRLDDIRRRSELVVPSVGIPSHQLQILDPVVSAIPTPVNLGSSEQVATSATESVPVASWSDTSDEPFQLSQEPAARPQQAAFENEPTRQPDLFRGRGDLPGQRDMLDEADERQAIQEASQPFDPMAHTEYADLVKQHLKAIHDQELPQQNEEERRQIKAIEEIRKQVDLKTLRRYENSGRDHASVEGLDDAINRVSKDTRQYIESQARPNENPSDTISRIALGEKPKMTQRGDPSLVGEARRRAQEQLESAGTDFDFGAAMFSGLPPNAVPQQVVDAVKQFGDQMLKLMAPQRRGPQAKETQMDLRERSAKVARAMDQFNDSFRAAEKLFDHKPASENIDRIQRAETGKLDPKDGLDGVLKSLQDNQKKLLAHFERVKPGITEGWDENYFRHKWQDPVKAQAFLESWQGKRPFEGSKSILRKRTVPTTQDGINAGLIPATTNPVSLMKEAYVQSQKYVTARDVMGNMKDDGRVVFAANRRKAPPGWQVPNDPMFEVWSRGENRERILRGHYYVPEEVATLFNNYFSRPAEADSQLFALAHKAAHLQTMGQLGLSAFHATMTTVQSATTQLGQAFRELGTNPKAALAHAVTSPGAIAADLVRGHQVRKAWLNPELATPQMREIADAYVSGGGRAFFDADVRKQFSKRTKLAAIDTAQAVSNRQFGLALGGAVRTILNSSLAGIEQVARPIMEYMVPMAKAGAFYKRAMFELERNPGMTLAELRPKMTQIVDDLENRFGEVTHDNTMTKGWIRSLQNISLRAFQYTAGTLREHGGAAADTYRMVQDAASGKRPQFTDRQAYVLAEMTLAGIIGGSLHYALTRKKPETTKDLFFPRDGGVDAQGNETRLRVPGYLNDLVSIWHSPATALGNKLNPLLSEIYQLSHNKDYYGEKIYGEGGQGTEKYLAKQFLPFSVQNLMKAKESGSSPVLPWLGFGRAPGYIIKTAAQQAVADWHQSRGEGPPVPAAQFEQRQGLSQSRQQAMQQGGLPELQAEMDRQLAAGQISKRQASDSIKRAGSQPLVWGIRQMPFEDAADIWRRATAEERTPEFRAAIAGKLANALKNRPGQDQEKLLQLADQIGIQPQSKEKPMRLQSRKVR